jgi:hypothetical protein
MLAPILAAALAVPAANGGISASLLANLTNIVTVAVGEKESLNVLSAADVERVVAFEAEKQAMGCEEAESCLAEVAGAMGARWIVFGDVGKVGSRYLVTLSLFDSDAGAAKGRKIGRATSEDELVDAAENAARDLVASLEGGDDVKVVVLKLRSAGGVVVEDEPAPEPTEPVDGGSVLLWSGVGGVVLGGAIAGVGGFFGLQTQTKVGEAEAEPDQLTAAALYDDAEEVAGTANLLFIVGGAVAVVAAGVAVVGVME